jgi:hypothetical protein
MSESIFKLGDMVKHKMTTEYFIVVRKEERGSVWKYGCRRGSVEDYKIVDLYDFELEKVER